MTVKVVVLYAKPDDPDEFDRYYFGTHMPLVHAMPGLERTETAKLVAAIDGGEKTFYRLTELYFADRAALDASFGSAEGAANSADYQKIAPPGSRLFLATADD
jgi:uncharacterized protein (TIGR02118 family)